LKLRIQSGKRRIFHTWQVELFQTISYRREFTAKAKKQSEGGSLTGNWRPLDIGSEVLL
jgi:hypothetical protein